MREFGGCLICRQQTRIAGPHWRERNIGVDVEQTLTAARRPDGQGDVVVFLVAAGEGAVDCEGGGGRFLLAGEVVIRLHGALDAGVQIRIPGVISAVHGVLEARGEVDGDIELAVLAAGRGIGAGAYSGSELFAEGDGEDAAV